MKTITIEELLHWAFVHELGKGGGVNGLDHSGSAWRQMNSSSWGLVSDYAELCTLIDRDRSANDMWIEQGAPHDDALEVGQAVKELANLEVVFPKGLALLSDWPETHGLGDEVIAHAISRYKLRTPQARQSHIIGLVISTAVMNRIPDFEVPVPEIQMITRKGNASWFRSEERQDAFGRNFNIEVDGYNYRSRRPYADAYRKYEFLTDPVSDILGRIDYQVWVAALKYLESSLMARLVNHRLVHTDLSYTPWNNGYDGDGVGLIAADTYSVAKKLVGTC